MRKTSKRNSVSLVTAGLQWEWGVLGGDRAGL